MTEVLLALVLGAASLAGLVLLIRSMERYPVIGWMIAWILFSLMVYLVMAGSAHAEIACQGCPGCPECPDYRVYLPLVVR